MLPKVSLSLAESCNYVVQLSLYFCICRHRTYAKSYHQFVILRLHVFEIWNCS